MLGRMISGLHFGIRSREGQLIAPTVEWGQWDQSSRILVQLRLEFSLLIEGFTMPTETACGIK